jgi:hypothetical protein
MATRTKTRKLKNPKTQIVVPEVTEMETKIEAKPSFLQKNLSLIIGVVAVVFAIFGFWWKTNSWPIVALVNYKPIWRFQLEDQMFKQIGQQALDGMVSERLIVDEVTAKKIMITKDQVNAKYDQIKTSFGDEASFTQLMTMQGITEDQLKSQIKIQLGIEELIKGATDAASATEPGFMQDAAYRMVQDLKSKAKIWMIK